MDSEQWERRLSEDLDRAAGAVELVPGDPAGDVERGRRALRRRRLGVLIGAVAVLSAVGAGALGAQGLVADDSGFAADGSDRPPTAGPPSPDTHEPPSESPESGPSGHAFTDLGPQTQREFNRMLFDTSRRRLDPRGTALNHDSYQGFRGGVSSGRPGDYAALGARFGWRGSDGPSDEGMVFVTVATTRGGQPCGAYQGGRCEPIDVPGGEPAFAGGDLDATGTETVQVRQSDGEWVTIVVSATFGNNGTTVDGPMRITRDRLIALAQDDGLDLP